MSGAPQSASGGVGTDPVCAAKSLIRLFKGQSNTFYLYRLTKEGVERPLLTDRKLDLSTYAVAPGAVLEFIGPFSGQCEAIAAWRKALRNGREAPPSPDTEIEYRPGSRP